ncbi:hypothetical protein PR202_gb25077 [Eleusine coracana subsp. coracana]|uniref:Uncharacterized protein n=1 Tax=Eleusine coracana subsp. coracana TaxID=191504 RepID=A0AAV5FML0_ELECO|nr:hypothetical protein PR202_gb25077 [Eleusine coracana subsp. coracana]
MHTRIASRTLAAATAAAMTSVRISSRSMLPSIGKVPEMVRQAALRRELEGCQLLAGIWCHGLTVAQLRSIRSSLPPTARLLVTKNSDMAGAVAGTRWEALRPCARGMNAWLFDFTGAVYEGRLYGPDDFAQLEAMPTSAQSYQYLLGCLQMPAVNVLAVLRARQEAMTQADKPPAEAEDAAAPATAPEK